tara:strand:+ start:41 stop:544 length:504 start_codon:yes stop_codon:yes gene_type:complete
MKNKLWKKLINVFKRKTIYGELTFKGVNELIQALDIKDNYNGVFLDVGSGHGKTVIAIKEMFTKSKCYGIEIVEERIKIANKLKWSTKVDFIQGDLKNNKKTIQKADIIFTNSLMFDEKDMKFIIDNNRGILIHNNSKFKSSEKIRLSCSWSSRKQTFYKINTNTNR